MQIKYLDKIFFTFLALSYVIIRNLLIINRDITFDPFDSSYYFEFKFFNAFRLPVITGVYSLIGDYEKIAIFQNLFSSLAWLFFSGVATLLVIDKRIKFVVFFSLLLLSLTELAIFRDTYLLAESFTLSGFLFISGSMILFVVKRNLPSFILLLFSMIFFSGVKTTNTLTIFLLLIFSIPILTFLVFYKKIPKAFIISMFIALMPFTIFLHSSVTSQVTSQLNTSAHLNSRLWTHDDWRKQILESGYPPELRTVWRDRDKYNLGETPDQGVVNEEIYQLWWRDIGQQFLIKFMITNPDYTFAGPFLLPIINGKFNHSQTLLYGLSQDPNYFSKSKNLKLVSNLFWPQTRSLAYLTFGFSLILIGITIIVLTNSQNAIKQTSIIVMLIVFYLVWSLISWWFGSKPPSDILRHQEAAAIMIRALALICLAMLIEFIFTFKKSVK